MPKPRANNFTVAASTLINASWSAPCSGSGVGNHIATALLATVILSTEFFASIPTYSGIASSRAAGMIAVASIAILVIGTLHAQTAKLHKFTILDRGANQVIFALLLITLVILHGIIAAFLNPIDFGRFSASLFPLIFLIAGAMALSSILRVATASQINTVLWITFYIFVGVMALRALGIQPRASAYSHSTFPFSETSHFALAFGPIYLYRCARSSVRSQYLWIIFGLACAVLLRSATLMAFVGGAALLCRKVLVTASIIMIPLLAGAAAHLTYFTSRANISSHSSSISALVYLQGWEFVVHSLRISHGWGLGFQQLGIHPESVPASRLIRAMNDGKNLNTKDGSFLFSKLVSEAGIFGIVISSAYLVLCWSLIRRIRSRSVALHDMFAYCLIIGFGVDIFIRGIGYFYGQPLLFLGALFSLHPPKGIFRMAASPDSDPRFVFR